MKDFPHASLCYLTEPTPGQPVINVQTPDGKLTRAIRLRETNLKFKNDYDAIRAKLMSPSHCPCCGQEIAR